MPWRREEGGISRAAQAVRKGGRQRSSTAKKKSGSENSPHPWTQSPRPEMCRKEVVPVVLAKSRRVLLSFPLRGVRGSGPPVPAARRAAPCALQCAGQMANSALPCSVPRQPRFHAPVCTWPFPSSRRESVSLVLLTEASGAKEVTSPGKAALGLEPRASGCRSALCTHGAAVL